MEVFNCLQMRQGSYCRKDMKSGTEQTQAAFHNVMHKNAMKHTSATCSNY